MFIICDIILVVISLIFLRIDIAKSSLVDIQTSVHLGLFVGIFKDVLLIATSYVFSKFLSKKYWKLYFLFFTFLSWSSLLSFSMFFSFFKIPLTLDIIFYHFTDSTKVISSIKYFFSKQYLLLSLVFFIAHIIFVTRIFKSKTDTFLKRRVIYLLLVVLFISLNQFPVWTRKVNIFNLDSLNSLDTIFSSEPFLDWFSQLLNVANIRQHQSFDVSKKSYYKNILQKYSSKSDWPYDYRSDSHLSKRLKNFFGFNTNQNISVVYLFVESFRSYEFDHPIIGPLLYPELRKILSNHSIGFSHTYSSVFEAGQTSRGIWSVECSFFLNMGGVAPFILNPLIEQKCFPEILKKQGYKTFAFFPADKGFHNNLIFSKQHGIENYYDKNWFIQNGAIDDHQMGVNDADYFRIAYQKIIKDLVLNSNREPFFSRLLTFSTHHPPVFNQSGYEKIKHFSELPKEVDTLNQWTQLSYSDSEVSKFIYKLFELPNSENILLVLVGDHSTSLMPHLFKGEVYTDIKRNEILFRVPLAMISKNSKSKIIHEPVHQIDVSPSVLQILGYNVDQLTWIGKNYFLENSGSDFFTGGRSLTSWYQKDTGRCLYKQNNSNPAQDVLCFKEKKQDLLFESNYNLTINNNTDVDNSIYDAILRIQNLLIINNKMNLK
jgi:phosphoglycerol transferase MdoB-like AlkP superfamily enzyme